MTTDFPTPQQAREVAGRLAAEEALKRTEQERRDEEHRQSLAHQARELVDELVAQNLADVAEQLRSRGRGSIYPHEPLRDGISEQCA